MSTEQLAIIEEAGVGRRDTHSPVLWFNVSGDGWGALQVFGLASQEALDILTEVYDVRDLDGRACVVTKENRTVRFVRLLKPARRLKRGL